MIDRKLITRLKYTATLILIVFSTLLSQGCTNGNDLTPTSTITQVVSPSPNHILTISAYETQISELTMTAQSSAVPSPTWTPTVTPIPPTKVPTSTTTPILRNCNRAAFVRDVTVPDGTEIDGGEAFTKTWRLRNAGECSWTTAYNIVFVGGESFKAPIRIGMPRTVDPGETVDISLLLEAPTYPGSYTGYFMLSDEKGDQFGTGVDGNQQIWVNILVRSPDATVVNFTEIYCKAIWRSSVEGSLPCPGDASSHDDGFVIRQENPLREDGSPENEAGLIISPDNSNYGFTYGIFPSFIPRKGDIFKSVISCTYDSPGCDLIFELRYQIEGGAMRTIKSWGEIYDRQYHSIIADLSDLAGFNVNLILYVENNGTDENNRGLWIAPRVMR